MDMIEHIKRYYDSEKTMALIGAGIGVVFLLMAWISVRQPGDEPLYRGLTYTLLVFGLLFLLGLGILFQPAKTDAEINPHQQTNRALQQAELHRIAKILATGYRLSGILASVAIGIGVVLLSTNSGHWLKGIGLGILLLGTALHTIDFFSINKHKVYYQTIQKLTF